jgi:hypothetical protein
MASLAPVRNTEGIDYNKSRFVGDAKLYHFPDHHEVQ